MKIIAVDTAYISVPLKRAFKTAVRTAAFAEAIIVQITDENGICGYGEGAVSPNVTGETRQSIQAAIQNHIAPKIIGRRTADFEELLQNIQNSILYNNCAKAAVDTALYDLKSREEGITLRQLLGGGVSSIDSCITISLHSARQMANDSVAAVSEGFKTLKLKLGGSTEADLERACAVRRAVGAKYSILVDANQGWGAKQAVQIISQMEDMGLNIELFEQPVPAWNLDALKYVTQNVITRVAADESVFSLHDAQKILSTQSADIINIKLMKTGGIYAALKLCKIAEEYNTYCMLGCMLETGLSVNAAAQLAAANTAIAWRDLDAPFLCAEYNYGGASFTRGEIILPHTPGTGCNARALFVNKESEA